MAPLMVACAFAWLAIGAAGAAPSAESARDARFSKNSKPAAKPKISPKLAALLVGRSAAAITATDVWLSPRLRGADLERLKVGDQAGLLKIIGPDATTELFVKQDPHISIKGLDTVLLARVTPDDQRRVLEAMQISVAEIDTVTRSIIEHFEQLPQRQAVALLGVMGAAHGHETTAASSVARAFLGRLLGTTQDVSLRRQCVLALAIAGATDETTVRRVVAFMTESHNAWETFTTQQFFDFHRDYVRSLATASSIAEALERSGNPYAHDIAATLLR